MTPKTLVEKMNWRYAVKRFDSTKKIPDQDWQTLKELLILTPSSFGLQPWKFLIVQNPEIRKQLRAASWNQSQVEDCSHFVVFLGKDTIDEPFIKKYIDHHTSVQSLKPDSLKGYYDVIVNFIVKGPRAAVAKEWAARQVYIALGNFMTVAALMNIDTCPMEGIDNEKYDEILKLKGTGYSTLFACGVGYRSTEDRMATSKKVRFHHDDVVQYIK